MPRRILGGVLFFGAFLVGAYLVSAGNNLIQQPVLLQPQTWRVIIIGGVMALIGLTLLLDKEETP